MVDEVRQRSNNDAGNICFSSVWFMVFNTTFNNISVVAVSLLVEETVVPPRRKPLTYRKSLTNLITYCCIKYTSPRAGFEFITLVVIGTDCTGCSEIQLSHDHDRHSPASVLEIGLQI